MTGAGCGRLLLDGAEGTHVQGWAHSPQQLALSFSDKLFQVVTDHSALAAHITHLQLTAVSGYWSA